MKLWTTGLVLACRSDCLYGAAINPPESYISKFCKATSQGSWNTTGLVKVATCSCTENFTERYNVKSVQTRVKIAPGAKHSVVHLQ